MAGNTLHVGEGRIYKSLSQAIGKVNSGDTILIHSGVYKGGLQHTNLTGKPDKYITIKAAPYENEIYRCS